ncbi:MAG: hypothetical protein ACE5EH_12685 [Gammaproteobacteria bacterium]
MSEPIHIICAHYDAVNQIPATRLDLSGKRDYKLLHGKAVPIIIVGDKRMNGFTAARFDKLSLLSR